MNLSEYINQYNRLDRQYNDELERLNWLEFGVDNGVGFDRELTSRQIAEYRVRLGVLRTLRDICYDRIENYGR